MTDTTLVSVDLETAGTRMGASPIIAIGACRVDRDWEAEWDRLDEMLREIPVPHIEPGLFYVELTPPSWAPWDAESEQYHGLSREHLAERGRHPHEALTLFIDWVRALGPAPHRVVSHNAAFDWAHLGAHFVHYELDDPFDPFPACTKNIARGIFRDDALSGQTALRERLGMKPHLGSHHGLADALSQAVLYQRLMSHS